MTEEPLGFNLLLRALPQEFRNQHREEMRDLLQGYSAGRGWLARTSLWVHSALDILLVGVQLRLRTSIQSRKGRSMRDDRRLQSFDVLRQDLRYCIRSLRRDAGLTIFATLIVALGVGASTTVFSVVNALLLRPLPFSQPEQLVWISNGEWGRGQQLSSLSVQVSHLEDLRSDGRQFVDVAGYSLFDRTGDHTLTGTGAPERLTRLRVTENFFPLLGVTPSLGRLFTTEEAQWGGPRAILLDHGFWVRRFASDESVVGQTITLNGEAATVVGILPHSFDFASIFAPENPIDFVSPFPLSEETNRQGNTLALIGRLQPTASISAAQAEATLIASRETPQRRNTFAPFIVPLREHVSGPFQTAMFMLVASVGLVMLIVCANISNLLLARGTTREKEIAIRSALGADRSRLIRQMLTESIVLSSIGCLLGLALAIVLTHVLTTLDVNIPLLDRVRIDVSALGFILASAVLAGVIFGIVPAFRTSQFAPQSALGDGGRGSTGGRQVGIQDALIVGEVALACVLLIGAGLLSRSLYRLIHVDLGFRPESAVTIRIDPAMRPPSHELRVANYAEMLRRVREAPGVGVAGITDVLPTAFNRRWCIPGDDNICPFVRVVSERYIDAMGLSLVAGRDFTERDMTDTKPVALVNDKLAELLWPDQEPLGRTFRAWSGELLDWEVIGVVRGMRHLTPEQEPGPEMFFPFRQMPHGGAMHLIARGPRTVEDLVASLRTALTDLDGSLPLNQFQPVREIIDRSLSPRRFVATLLAAFAGFAVVLASLGIYGVISYSVNQRKQEMGIRLALGASAGSLRGRVLRQTLTLAGLGMAVGLASGWMLSRSINSLLFGIDASDPLTFTVAPVTLLLVAALAGYLPARRLTQLDPVSTLRVEH